MPDFFANSSHGLDSPTTRGFAVTPHNSNPLVDVPRFLFVGGAGNIVMRLRDDSADVTLTGVTAGSVLWVRPTHVRATGTTATNIVALH
jgi:hypothetical protein